MKKVNAIIIALTATVFLAGCSSLKGTVYKQNDGYYKATYAASNEKSVRKAIHADAMKTCEDKADTEEFTVIAENVENMEDDSKKEGFAAVAGSAVSLAGKYFGSESVRGSLIFECNK